MTDKKKPVRIETKPPDQMKGKLIRWRLPERCFQQCDRCAGDIDRLDRAR